MDLFNCIRDGAQAQATAVLVFLQQESTNIQESRDNADK